MFDKSKKKYSIAYLFITISFGVILSLSLFIGTALSKEKSPYEVEYLHQKSLGNYEESINVIVEWTQKIEDIVLIDINLLRIYELINYSEMIDVGISAFNDIINGNRVVRSSRYLRDRVDILKGILLFRRGDIAAVRGFKKKFGYIDKFSIIGPFSNRRMEEFERHHLSVSGYDSDLTLMGKNYHVRWFDVNSDWVGIIDIDELFSDLSDSLFYLYSEVGIDKSGIYRLTLGKTGYVDIWVDGNRIFSNRKEHGFFFDQYSIEVYLPEGKHNLMIKIGSFEKRDQKLSLRITDKHGKPVDLTYTKNTDGLKDKCKLIKSTFFATLENLIAEGTVDPYRSFLAGYLYYICNLTSVCSDEARSLLLNAERLKYLTSAIYFYIGKIEKNSINKEHYFYESLKTNSDNIEAIYQISRIKLSKGFIYEAYPLIESIGSIKKNSIPYLLLKASAFESMGWYDEALRVAETLKNSRYPSVGYSIEGMVYKKQKRFKRAFEIYKRLNESEKRNWTYTHNTIACSMKIGDYRTALKILNQAILLYPNSVRARLMLCNVIDRVYGVKASIPYLSSVMKISPYNKRLLLRIGIAYHKIGKDELAKYYLKMANSYDPKNFSLRRYLKIINREYNGIEDLLFKDDLIILSKEAEKYKYEPAVTLLDEIAIRVFSDGSTERRVHKVFKINDKSVIDDFSRQYIIFDPSYDRVEELRCVVINDGKSIEVTGFYNRSLSDPDSRLYYDMQARIISIPSLRKGSIVDLKYVVKRKRSEAYKNYFGEKLIAGGEYRTLVSNIILSFPKDKHIYYYLKGVKKRDFRLIENNKRKVYNVCLRNIPPYKKETSIPHYSEFLPTVYFTSHRSWNELHRWYLSLLRNRIRVSPEMKDAVSRIIGENDSILKKVRKVYNHVNRQIRYVGFEFGIGSIQPRSTDLTYHTRMGDCKDISMVLIAMLREVGIDARLALVRTRDKGKANLKIPYLGEFNHAICYVGSGKGMFLDATSKFSGMRELPSDDLDMVSFVLDEKGYHFINTFNSYYHSNIERVTTDVYIDEKGNAELYRKLYKLGVLASRMRSGLRDKAKKLRMISEYWNRNYTGSSIRELKIHSIDNDSPVRYEYRIKIPSFLNVGKDESVFNSFLISSNYYRNYAILKKRRNPLILSSRWISQIKIRYHLPDNYEIVRIPKSENFRHSKFDAVFKYKKSLKGNVIEVESLFRFKDYRIKIDEYDRFRKFTRFIHKKENERIIFMRKKD